MSRLLFRLSLCLAAVIFALALTARAWGGTQLPDNPALRGFIEGCEGKPQPCWYGIVPGQTGLDEAIARLHELGMMIEIDNSSRFDPVRINFRLNRHDLFHSIWQDDLGRVDLLHIFFNRRISLAEAIAVLGHPSTVGIGGDNNFVQMQFMPNTLAHFEPYREYTGGMFRWFPLSTELKTFTLYPDDRVQLQGFRWTGLQPRWRYCQTTQSNDERRFIWCHM